MRVRTTEGLVMKLRPFMAEWIPIPPDPPPDEFEATMFRMLDMMSDIHEETYGKKPTKIKLGTFERRRFKRHIVYAGMDRVYEEEIVPSEFPLTHFLREVDKAYAKNVKTKTKTSIKPIYKLKGLKVVDAGEYFHFEPI